MQVIRKLVFILSERTAISMAEILLCEVLDVDGNPCVQRPAHKAALRELPNLRESAQLRGFPALDLPLYITKNQTC